MIRENIFRVHVVPITLEVCWFLQWLSAAFLLVAIFMKVRTKQNLNYFDFVLVAALIFGLASAIGQLGYWASWWD